MKGLVRFITFLFFVGIILLAFLFAWNNTTEISLWMRLQFPPLSVAVLVICAFILGGIMGLVLGLRIFQQLKYILQIRHLRSQLDKLSKSGDERPQSGR